MSFDPHLVPEGTAPTRSLLPIAKPAFKKWLSEQPDSRQAWVNSSGFSAETGSLLLLPDDGSALFGWDKSDFWSFAALPGKLPAGDWKIALALPGDQANSAALGWGLGNYAFTRFKTKDKKDAKPRLAWPEAADRAHVTRMLEGMALARDLINMPANEMGPTALAAAAETVAKKYGAEFKVIVGDALLAENYPTIHAVGRAAADAPRLVDLRWGPEEAPKLTLVGKGVCFDSGGLDLKSSANMKLMKKDMGGAAIVLGLAQAIMDAGLKLRLRVLIPAVENAVSGNAFRPLDVITTRKGMTVEIGNTDAEGRLILCDALCEADREKPDLLLDLATLTGAARVALGPDLVPIYTADDALAADLLAAAEREHDPMWRMPLWKPYRKMLDSKIADINNASDSTHAGSVTAALFLQEFVSPGTAWAHFDVFGWNPAPKPGRPEGGEAMALRALFSAIRKRFSV
jgi:leucyl aminopeptidase